MKKITITAIKKAVKSHYGLNELKEVNRTETTITFAKNNSSIIKFEIIGKDKNFIGWTSYGYLNYIVSEWLNEVMKVLEKWLT